MKLFKNSILGLSLLLIAPAAFSQSSLPDSIIMETSNGEKINLKEYIADSGKITVIFFWATWNESSIKGLDNIDALYLDWQEEYDVNVIAVNVDHKREKVKVKQFIPTKDWEFDFLYCSNLQPFEALGYLTAPYTILLDSEGNIIYTHSGYTEGDEFDLGDEIADAAE